MITSLVLLIRTDLNYDSEHLFVSVSDCICRKYFINNKAMYATDVVLISLKLSVATFYITGICRFYLLYIPVGDVAL